MARSIPPPQMRSVSASGTDGRNSRRTETSAEALRDHDRVYEVDVYVDVDEDG